MAESSKRPPDRNQHRVVDKDPLLDPGKDPRFKNGRPVDQWDLAMDFLGDAAKLKLDEYKDVYKDDFATIEDGFDEFIDSLYTDSGSYPLPRLTANGQGAALVLLSTSLAVHHSRHVFEDRLPANISIPTMKIPGVDIKGSFTTFRNWDIVYEAKLYAGGTIHPREYGTWDWYDPAVEVKATFGGQLPRNPFFGGHSEWKVNFGAEYDVNSESHDAAVQLELLPY